MQVSNNEWTAKKHELMRLYNNGEANPDTGQLFTQEEYEQKFKEYSDKEHEILGEALRDMKDRAGQIQEEVKAAQNPESKVKINKTDIYKNSIALYREGVDFVKFMSKVVKKDVRDWMVATRKSHKDGKSDSM
jgi:hypothetical protein